MMRILVIVLAYLEVVFGRLRRLIGRPLSTEEIPQGLYCYEFINQDQDRGDHTLHIKTCPYYRDLGNERSACVFADFIGYDLTHADKCKICGENIDEINDD